MSNTNNDLHLAKKKRLDEFYTKMEDIEVEMGYYRNHFQQKSIFCNCDDPEYSNFWKYFKLNFDFFNLKRLISTHYEKKNPSYCLEISRDRRVNEHSTIKKNLKQNGDFRSPEAIEIMKTADVIITNPPFSLFREYINQLIMYDKKFIVMGNVNAVTYKEIFPLIKNNKLWLGPSIHSGDREFQVPKKYTSLLKNCRTDELGKCFVRIKGVRWFTNLDHKKRHEELILHKSYTPEKYPKYDNYDAINVNKVMDIPKDYDGVMGVPITFIDKHNLNQFEILGCSNAFGEPKGYHHARSNYNVSILGKQVYKRLFIRRIH